MRNYAYRILNVFAREERLSGNPLCVFEDGRGLDDGAMQALARQFNLSETTFILPSERASARVRIFTPSYEMPFAGHPTLGTAHVVRSLAGGGDALTLEMIAGIIPVSAVGDRWTLAARDPRWREVEESRGELASMLGLAKRTSERVPCGSTPARNSSWCPWRRRRAVRDARPRGDVFSRLKSEDGQSMAYVFADAGDGEGRVESRFFFPTGAAILEDPATGSACANLGGWFCATRPGADIERVVSQGEALARPSTLRLRVRDGAIFVGGDVIELGRGSVDL